MFCCGPLNRLAVVIFSGTAKFCLQVHNLDQRCSGSGKRGHRSASNRLLLMLSSMFLVLPPAASYFFTFLQRRYFLVALCVTGLYSIITLLASISVMMKPDFSLKFLLHFALWDVLMLGILASATGAAAAIAYLGLKGDDHLGWMMVCNTYDKFCRYLAASLAVSLFGSVVLVLLVWFAIHSLHRRVPA